MSSASTSSAADDHALAASPSTSTISSLIRLLVASDEVDTSLVLKLCFTIMYTARQHILQPILTDAAVVAPASSASPSSDLLLKSIISIWDSRIDRVISQQFGSSVSSDAAPAVKGKTCGPLLDALRIEWKQRINAKSLNSHVEYIDVFASATMLQWFTVHVMTYWAGASQHNTFRRNRFNEMIAACISQMFRDWAQHLRESPNPRITFTPQTCVDDFLTIAKENLLAFIHPKTVDVNIPNRGSANKPAAIIGGAELAKIITGTMQKITVWTSQFLAARSSGSGKAGFVAAAASSESAVGGIYHTCKFEACAHASGTDIEPSAKYVSVRCSEGCASVFHPACYDELSAAFVEKEDGSIPCWHAEDERKCTGFMGRALLKHQGKFVSHLIMTGVDKDTDDDKAAYNDPQADDDEDAIPEEHELADPSAASVGSRATSNNNLMSGSDARFWGRSASTSYGRVRVTEDGQLLFKDELVKMELREMRAEKKKREEERAIQKAAQAEIRKKDEEERKKKLELEAATKHASASEPKKVVSGFEVVVPLTKPVGESRPKPKSKPQPAAPLTAWNSSNAAESPAVASAWFGGNPSADASEENSGFLPVISVKRKGFKSKSSVDPEWAAAMAESRALANQSRTKEEIEEDRRQKKLQKKLEKEKFRQQLAEIDARHRAENREEGDNEAEKEEENASEEEQENEQDELDENISEQEEGSISSGEEGSQSSSSIRTESSLSNGYGNVASAVSASSSPFPTITRTLSTSSSVLSHQSSPLPSPHNSVVSIAQQPPKQPVSAVPGIPFMFASAARAIALPMKAAAASKPAGSAPILTPTHASSNQVASVPQPPSAIPSPHNFPSSHVAPPPSVPAPTPIPVVTPPPTPALSIQHVDDIVECVPGTPTPILLLRNLPSQVTITNLGQMFCTYGKLRVNLMLTRQHGLTGVMTYQTETAALNAMQAMRGRTYQLESVVDGSLECEQWKLEDFARAAYPLKTTALPTIKLRLVQQ